MQATGVTHPPRRELTHRGKETMAKCNQNDCENDACWKYTWPGKDESYSCLDCLIKVQTVAQAIGLHLQMRPMTMDDYKATANSPEA